MTLFLESHEQMSSPDRESMIHQSKETVEAQLREPVSFTGVTNRNRRNVSSVSKTAVPSKAHHNMGDSS